MRPDLGTRARLALLAGSDSAPVSVREPITAPSREPITAPFREPGAPPSREPGAPPSPEPIAAPSTSTGWVPGPPEARQGPEPVALAVPAVSDSLGIRDRALASAVAAYTAAYGHPLQAESITPGLRRWATPGRTAVAAVAAVLLLGGVVVARAAQRAPSEVVALEDAQSGSGGPDGVVDAGVPVTEPSVVVHVVGQVAQPGVVTLPEESRVADAIDAAGGAGPEADLSAVNLARVLVDGEQVVVPRPGEATAPVGGPGAGSGGGLLNLNVAEVGALDALPGIGPVLAQRIVDWRTEHERFSNVEELTEVSGIGPSLLEDVRDLVTVG